MATTYILIDFENVQPAAEDVGLIRGRDFKVFVFHGPHQNKFDAGVVKALQPLGAQVEYLQSEQKGKNALDFHIAFVLGRLVEENQVSTSSSQLKASFIVVSRDGGFDALLDHVKSLGYRALRVESIRQAMANGSAVPDTQLAPAKNKAPAKPGPAPVKAAKPDPKRKVIENLRDHPRNRPTTAAALERHVTTLLGKDTTVKTVLALIAKMQKEGLVVLTDKKVEYKLPAAKD
jgi:hypothetical protein